eukprot:g27749.t1
MSMGPWPHSRLATCNAKIPLQEGTSGGTYRRSLRRLGGHHAALEGRHANTNVRRPQRDAGRSLHHIERLLLQTRRTPYPTRKPLGIVAGGRKSSRRSPEARNPRLPEAGSRRRRLRIISG